MMCPQLPVPLYIFIYIYARPKTHIDAMDGSAQEYLGGYASTLFMVAIHSGTAVVESFFVKRILKHFLEIKRILKNSLEIKHCCEVTIFKEDLYLIS
jgi:hypothetical protein